MLTSRYLVTVKNLTAILQKIVQGTAPQTFTVAHLKGLGFKSSNDVAVIPLLKDLKFLTAEGKPTQRYQDYRDASRSRQVMAQALREAYEDLFHINAKPSETDRGARSRASSNQRTTQRTWWRSGKRPASLPFSSWLT